MLALRSLTMALVLVVLGGLPAFAADGPLAAFPKDTGVIVRLKNPQKTLQRAGELAVKVDRTEGVKVQLAGPMLGQMISNPSLKGVDMAGDWGLGVFPVENGDPGVVFCIPATDAKAFQENVMGDYQFQTLEKYLIYTENQDTAAKIKQHIAAKGASISTLLDKTSTAVWDEGDVSVFVNVPQILKVYKGPFDQGVEQANQFIEQMPNLVPQQQGGFDMKAIAGLYAGIFKAIVQAVRDADGCTAALVITADGISVNEYLKFGEATETAKALAKQKPDALELLDQLPKGRLGYAAAELDAPDLMKLSIEFGMKMMVEGDTEKENQMKKLMAEYEKVKFQGVAFAFGLGDGKQGAIRGTSIMKVEDANKLRDLSKETSKLMGDYNFGGMKMKVTYQPEAETYGNLKADLVRVKYEFDQEQNPFHEMQSKMNDILYGPEGMVTRTLYTEDRMVQTIGGDKADLQAALDAQNGKNAIGKEAAYQAARKKLLPQANLIGLLDIPGTLAKGMELAIQAGAPIPLNENDLKEVRGEPSFVGISVAMEGGGVKAKTIVPVQQMQGIARFVRKVEAAERQQ